MISRDVDSAAQALRSGEVVAFATETVYGLGADAGNATAVAKIFSIKGRPNNHPLIVHVSSVASAKFWVGELSRKQTQWFTDLTKAFWPGPLTLILPRAAKAPDFACGGQSSIGLRCPSHPIALELLNQFEALGGKGIAAPSANRFGKVSPTTAAHVQADLGDDVSLILDGDSAKVGIESTIVSLLGERPALLRPGAITADQLEGVLGVTFLSEIGQQPQVSGSLDSHYAPNTAVELVSSPSFAWRARTLAETGEIYAVFARSARPENLRYCANLLWKQAPSDPEVYAHEVYAALREMDALGACRIVIEDVPKSEGRDALLWQAIRDRLKRAAFSQPGIKASH